MCRFQGGQNGREQSLSRQQPLHQTAHSHTKLSHQSIIDFIHMQIITTLGDFMFLLKLSFKLGFKANFGLKPN